MANDEDVIYVDVVPKVDEKAAEKAGKETAEKIKGGAKNTGTEIGKQITDEIASSISSNGNKAAAVLEKTLKDGAKTAGKEVGNSLAASLVDSLGDTKKLGSSLGGNLSEFLEKKIGDPFKHLKDAVGDKNLSESLRAVSEGLEKIGGSKAADTLNKFADATSKEIPYLTDLNRHLSDGKELFSGFDKNAGGLEGKLGRIGGKLGALSSIVSTLNTIGQLVNDPEIDKMLHTAPIIGDNSTLDKMLFQGPANAGKWLHDHLGLPTAPTDPQLQKPGGMFGPEVKTDMYGRKVAKGADGYDHLVDNNNNFIEPGKGWFFAKNPAPATNAESESSKSSADDTASGSSENAGGALGRSGRGPVHVIVDGFANGASAGGFSGGASSGSGGGVNATGAGMFQLPYDRSIQAQTLAINCGPSAANIVLNGQGIFRGQQGLTADMNTVANGQTPFGTELATLQRYAPQAGYTGVTGQNNPQKLMADLSKSVESGYGGVLNYDLVNGVRVQGVNGTNAPNYSEGTQHYVAVMGVDEKGGNIRVADPAPQGKGSDYWISAQNAAAATAGRGYIYGSGGPSAASVVSPAGAAGGGRRGGMSQGYGGGVPGMGQDMFFGPGIVSPPTMPNAAGPAPTGPKQQVPFGSGPGGGVSGGGLIGLAEQGIVGAATAAGFMGAGGPLAGMAAQAGTQIANQAISTGVQAASILASAPLQTFGLQGGQFGAPTVQLGGWAGKILGGLVGQQANTPNIAGATADPKKPDDKHDPLNGNQPPAGTPNGPSGGKDDPIHVKSADAPQQPPQGAASNNMNMGAGNLPQLQL